MTSRAPIFVLVALGSLLAACGFQEQPDPDPSSSFSRPATQLLTGGQPSQAELARLKQEGVATIINLRGQNEDPGFDERAEAEALGFDYVSLPISGAADITLENAKNLDALLITDGKILLHCASGNRVGALLAVRAHELEGKSVEASLELGRAAGLTSLEPHVRSILANDSSAAEQ